MRRSISCSYLRHAIVVAAVSLAAPLALAQSNGMPYGTQPDLADAPTTSNPSNPSNPDLDHERVAIDLQLGFGYSVTARASDAPGTLTLLYGSGYTGLAFHGGASVAYAFANNRLRFRTGLGMTRINVTGSADLIDPDACPEGCRRELRFGLTTVDIPVGLELFRAGDAFDWHLGGGLGARFGMSARVTDTRTGFEDFSGPPEIRIGPTPFVWLETGIALHFAQVSIPIAGRLYYNVGYPGTTEGRLDAESPTEEDPGSYLVETDWTFMFVTGIELWP